MPALYCAIIITRPWLGADHGRTGPDPWYAHGLVEIPAICPEYWDTIDIYRVTFFWQKKRNEKTLCQSKMFNSLKKKESTSCLSYVVFSFHSYYGIHPQTVSFLPDLIYRYITCKTLNWSKKKQKDMFILQPKLCRRWMPLFNWLSIISGRKIFIFQSYLITEQKI